jgi:hypothetical protein
MPKNEDNIRIGPKGPVSLMNATSTDVKSREGVTVVLYWLPTANVVGYNLYRQNIGETQKPSAAWNGSKPISQVTDRASFESLIPVNSPEWQQLQEAFTLIENKNALLTRRSVDPGKIIERGLTPEEDKAFEVLALANLKIRLARGLAFVDRNVANNEWYVYELRGLTKSGLEIALSSGVRVKAGHYILPDPPSNITATAGDHKVLLLWDRNPIPEPAKIETFEELPSMPHGFCVGRATSQGGYPQVISDKTILFDITKDLDNNDVTPPRPGFLDFQRWEEGLPVYHSVNGASIEGPRNYVNYYYRVASYDILGRLGSWSNEVSATPFDKTPPMSPQDLSVEAKLDAFSKPVGLVVSWRKVTKDVEGHVELDNTQFYRIYRSLNSDDLEKVDTLSNYLVATWPADPTDEKIWLDWFDNSPVIFPAYGEQDVWYRVCCEDAHQLLSSPSALISGRIPDVKPPGPTKMLGSESHEKFIRVFWKPNQEPDLAGYQIYRTICDRGTIYRPQPKPKRDVPRTSNIPGQPNVQGQCDLEFKGEILLDEADKRLAEQGRIYYDDYSVPPGSPLCYGYWVRAFDMRRNLYPGDNGCPASAEEYVCQRLHDETPPPVPIIAGLKARNNAVQIDWVASPIQDLKAFHVYRSEKEDDTPSFVGGVDLDGNILNGKWTGIEPACGDIPAELNSATVKGWFIDKNVKPNKVYWYRVSALDWSGNESSGGNSGKDLQKIPAISTFTYDANLPDSPAVLPCQPESAGVCGLTVRWSPAFDPSLVDGFVVFRSMAINERYRQVSPIIKGNEFSDKSAIRNTVYWYRVQAVDKRGNLSNPSQPVQYEY